MSLKLWKFLEATEWKHLPFPGAIVDQPEWLMEDLTTIGWRSSIVEQYLKQQGKPAES